MADGNEPQGAAAEPKGTEPQGAAAEPKGTQQHGAGAAGAGTVSKAEYDKLLARSRKWEERSKANAAKAKELDELKAATQTDAEKLAAAQKRADDAEAKVAELERMAERASIVSEVAAAKGVDADWLSRMSGCTREEVEANADYIASKLKGIPLYPDVNDNGAGKGTTSMTPDEIEKIKDPMARIRARAEYAARNRRK